MISSGAYFAYAGNRALEQRKRERDIRDLRSLHLESDNLRISIGSRMEEIFNGTFSRVERDHIVNGSDGSLEGELKSALEDRVPERIVELFYDYNSSRRDVLVFLERISVEANPIYGALDGVLPSESGDLIEVGERCKSLGVEANLEVSYILTDREGTVSVRDSVGFDFSRVTLSGLVESRTERLERALECGELHRLAAYMLTYLSQQKAALGYGRPSGSSVRYSPPLLTGREITDVVDLAVALISRSHLRANITTRDISKNISGWSASGGDAIPIDEVLTDAREDLDPATLLLLAAGFGSEGNPPSLSDVLRPILYSISELIATKLLVYTGTWNDAMAAIGALKNAIDKAYSAFSNAMGWLFGNDEKEEGREAVWSLFTDMLRRGGMDVTQEIRLLSEQWGEYPNMGAYSVVKDFDIYLSEEIPERRFWEDPDGNRFTEDQGVGDDDEFVGYKCDVHTVTAEFSMAPLKPEFNEVVFDGEGDFTEELIEVLGEDDGEVETSYEDLISSGSDIFRRAVDRTVESLSGSVGDDTWEELYEGWDREDHPDVCSDTDPITRYISLNLDGVEQFLDRSFSHLSNLMKNGEFPDLVDSYTGDVSGTTAIWMNDTYHVWTEREDQIEHAAREAALFFMDNCLVNVTDVKPNGSAILGVEWVTFPPKGAGDVDWALSDRGLMVERGLSYDEIEDHYLFEASDVYERIRSREVSTDPDDPGIYTEALNGSPTRGDSLFRPLWEMGKKEAVDSIFDVVVDQFQKLMESLNDTYSIPCARERIAPLPSSGKMDPKPWGELGGGSIGDFEVEARVERTRGSAVKVEGDGGEFRSSPEEFGAPYRSFFRVSFSSEYSVSYTAEGSDYGMDVSDRITVPVDLDIRVETDTFWPMDVGFYVPTTNIYNDTYNNVKRAAVSALDELGNLSGEYLGGTLGSVSELPPILSEVVESGEIDPSEISRVLSNISMDISGTVRECARDLIDRLVEEGLSATVGGVMDSFGIEEVSGGLSVGMLDVSMIGYTEALCGGEGLMFSIDGEIDSLGVTVHVELSRVENDSVRFNSTVVLDQGGLYVRLEADPFMDSMPHMLSVEGVLDEFSFSLKFPDITQRRTAEISLGSAIGFTPTVFIPPIGLSATFDAGFQLNYIQPSEMKPHLNEIRVVGGVVGVVEFFDPQEFGMNGFSIESVDAEGSVLGSARIYPEGETHPTYDTDLEVSKDGSLLLRDPSGVVMDDVELEMIQDGWFGRDKDGYGVWRWGEGSPGEPNSELVTFSFSSILISMAMDSISEAWEEAEGLYGLSFDGLIHFVQRALDLFVERVLEAVSELVLDARMFLKIKVVIGAGASGGLGIELSFLAEGEAVAKLLGWVYQNVKVFFSNIADPKGSGDYASFPIEIVELCHLEVALITEIETPSALSKFSTGSDLPDEITLGVSGRMSLSLPMNLVGLYSGGWSISLGVYIQGAPPPIVSMFYDLGSSGGEVDIWILRATVWRE